MDFTVGDLVTRTRYNAKSGEPDGVRSGTIVERYMSAPSTHCTQTWLYAVRWDDTQEVERGYCYVGLEKI